MFRRLSAVSMSSDETKMRDAAARAPAGANCRRYSDASLHCGERCGKRCGGRCGEGCGEGCGECCGVRGEGPSGARCAAAPEMAITSSAAVAMDARSGELY